MDKRKVTPFVALGVLLLALAALFYFAQGPFVGRAIATGGNPQAYFSISDTSFVDLVDGGAKTSAGSYLDFKPMKQGLLSSPLDSCSWDFNGDGTTDKSYPSGAEGVGRCDDSQNYQYTTSGLYSVKYSVTAGGETVSYYQTVLVEGVLRSDYFHLWKFDDVSGANVPDTGTPLAPDTLAPGTIRDTTKVRTVSLGSGKVMHFEGKGVSLGKNSWLQAPSDFTFTAWVKPEKTGIQRIFNAIPMAELGGWSIKLLLDNKPSALFTLADIDPNLNDGIEQHPGVVFKVEGTPPLPQDQWSLLTVTYTFDSITSKKATAKIFINGASAGSATSNPVYAGIIGIPTTEVIMGYDLMADESFVGDMDNPGFFNKILTDTEISTMHNTEKAKYQVISSPPIAKFDYLPKVGYQGLQVSFDASASSDPDDLTGELGYTWNFGDGYMAEGTSSPQTCTHLDTTSHDLALGCQKVTHRFDAPGTHYVTLTVKDSDGKFNSVMHKVIVIADQFPQARFTGETQLQIPSGATSVAGSFTDKSNSFNLPVIAKAWFYVEGIIGSNDDNAATDFGVLVCGDPDSKLTDLLLGLVSDSKGDTTHVVVFTNMADCDVYDSSDAKGPSFTKAGTYVVGQLILAEGSLPFPDLFLQKIEVKDANGILPPTELRVPAVSFTPKQTGSLEYSFDGSAVCEGGFVRYAKWHFGDGTMEFVNVLPNVPLETGHKYTEEGVKSVTLSALCYWVTDDEKERLSANSYGLDVDVKKEVVEEELPVVVGGTELGMIARWEFEEREGPAVLDSLGNIPGQIKGTRVTRIAEGKQGQALQLQGGDGRVDFGKDAHLTAPQNDFTFTAWVKPEQLKERESIFSSLEAAGWGLHAVNGKLEARFGFTTPSNEKSGESSDQFVVATPTAVLRENKFAFIGVRYDQKSSDATVDIYVDGALAATGTAKGMGNIKLTDASGLLGNEPTLTGVQDAGAYGFTGVIDQVTLYGKALTPSDFLNFYLLESLDLKPTGRVRIPKTSADYRWLFMVEDGKVFDVSRNKFSATLQGVQIEEIDGIEALHFDSTDDYVDLPSFGKEQEEYTLSFWMKLDATEEASAPATGKAGEFGGRSAVVKNTDRMAVEVADGEIVAEVLGEDGTPVSLEKSMATTDGYCHVAVAVGGDGAKLYVDGEKVAGKAFSPAPLGSGSVRFGEGFRGRAGRIRLDGRGLSEEDIQKMYRYSRAAFTIITTPPTDYLSRWRFDEASGTTVKDEAGLHDGVVVGTNLKRVAIEGRTNKVLHFPGGTEQVMVNKEKTAEGTTLPDLLKQMEGPMSISAWVKMSRAPRDGRVVASTHKEGNGWALGSISGSDDKVGFSIYNKEAMENAERQAAAAVLVMLLREEIISGAETGGLLFDGGLPYLETTTYVFSQLSLQKAAAELVVPDVDEFRNDLTAEMAVFLSSLSSSLSGGKKFFLIAEKLTNLITDKTVEAAQEIPGIELGAQTVVQTAETAARTSDVPLLQGRTALFAAEIAGTSIPSEVNIAIEALLHATALARFAVTSEAGTSTDAFPAFTASYGAVEDLLKAATVLTTLEEFTEEQRGKIVNLKNCFNQNFLDDEVPETDTSCEITEGTSASLQNAAQFLKEVAAKSKDIAASSSDAYTAYVAALTSRTAAMAVVAIDATLKIVADASSPNAAGPLAASLADSVAAARDAAPTMIAFAKTETRAAAANAAIPSSAEAKKQDFFGSYPNQWKQVVGTYDQEARELKFYVDGVKVGSQSGADIVPEKISYTTGNPLRFGQGNSAPWEGDLDDIMIFERPLSGPEIKALFLAGETAPCFNRYCPPQKSVEALSDFDDADSVLQETVDALSAVTTEDGISFWDEENSVLTAKDILKLQRPVAQKLITPNTAAIVPGLYFTYNDKHYLVSLKEQNQWEVTAKVVASSIAGGDLSPTLDLASHESHSLNFTPTQIELLLDEDPEVDVYLQAFGYYNKEKVLGLIIAATPFLDFDQASTWTSLLMSGQDQDFKLNGNVYGDDESGVGLRRLPDNNYVLFIGGEEFILDAAAEESSGMHYFNEQRTLAVKFTVKKLFGDSAVIVFERQPVDMAEVYEKTFTKDRPETVQGKILRICQNDPPIIAAVTVCENAVEIFDLLDRIPKTIEEFIDVLFWYKKPTEFTAENFRDLKQVSAFHIFRFDETPAELALFFANNLQEGRRLAIQLEEHYYLLSKKEGEPTPDLLSLQLSRITSPEGLNSYPDYRPAEGGDLFKIKFNLPLKKQINVQLVDDPNLKYFIQSTTSAVPEVVNLVDVLRATVDTYGSVTVHDKTGLSAAKTVAAAEDDLSVLQSKMKIKYASTSIELPYNITTVLPAMVLKDGFNNGKLLLHYNRFSSAGTVQEPHFTKYADAYLLYDLDEGEKKHTFNDEKFMLPLLRGRALAVKVNNQFYRLMYDQPWRESVGSPFQYSLLRLQGFDEEKVIPQILGDTITFDVDETTSVKLAVDTNRKTVALSRVTRAAAASSVAYQVELQQALQTNISTFRPVTLLDSEMATVSIHPEDLSSFQGVMRIRSSSGEDKELPINVPVILGKVGSEKVLFLYKTFTLSGSVYAKTADLYLLYDLNTGDKTRAFTSPAFLDPLLAGKKLALQFGDKQYLLGVSGTLGSTGFVYNSLRLQQVGGTEKAPDTVSGNEVTFKVQGGKVTLLFDTLARTVLFRGVQEGTFVGKFVPNRDITATLPPFSIRPGVDNVLDTGAVQFYNCDSATSREFSDSLFFCTQPGEQERIFKDQPVLRAVDEEQQVIVWYKGKSGTQKQVALQYVLGSLESSFTVSWQSLVANVSKSKNPVIALEGKYFEITGAANLASFALREIPSGKTYPGKLTLAMEGEQEYLVPVQGKILRFKQELLGREVTLRLELLPYLLIPAEGVTLSSGQFVSSLGSPQYTLSSSFDGTFVQVAIMQRTDMGVLQIYFTKLPRGTSRRILLPHGEALMIDVPALSTGEVVLRP